MDQWTRADAVRVLRNRAAIIEDDAEVALAQSIADYIESTAEHRGIGGRREFFAEIATAYVEGYEHASADRPRETWAALRAAGLTV